MRERERERRRRERERDRERERFDVTTRKGKKDIKKSRWWCKKKTNECAS